MPLSPEQVKQLGVLNGSPLTSDEKDLLNLMYVTNTPTDLPQVLRMLKKAQDEESLRRKQPKAYFGRDKQTDIKTLLKAAQTAQIEEAQKDDDAEKLVGESFISYTGKCHEIYFDDVKKQYYRLIDNLSIGGKQEKKYFDGDYFYSSYLRDKNCFGTYVNAIGDECEDWAKAVLDVTDKTDTDFKKIIGNKYISADFFNIAKTTIEKMHPVMAVQILKKFGFRKHRTYDETAGINLYKIESVDHWMKHVVQGHLYDKKAQIENLENTVTGYKLKKYLGLISEYINCNPGIINKGFTGTSDNQAGKDKIPEDAQIIDRKFPSTNSRRANIYAFGNFGNNQHVLGLGSSLYSPVMHSFMTGGQNGGGGFNGLPMMLSPFGTPTFTPGLSLLRETKEAPMCKAIKFHLENQGYQVIVSVYRGILSAFAAKGKTFPEETKKELERKIQNYKTIQEELVRTLCYIEEYTKAMDSTTQPGSLATMQKLGERLSKLTGKQGFSERNLMSNLMKLLLADESGDYKNL